MSDQAAQAGLREDFAVVDPRTGEVSARYPTMSDDALHGAIDRAGAAFEGWSQVDVGERATVLIAGG